MRKLIILFLLLPALAVAQTGKVFDNLSMTSKILKMERKYAVYLPPDYESSKRSYPVLYLLHGAGDDQTGWVQFGEVLHIADQAIREGIATPMIIIMPDAKNRTDGVFQQH
jgi:enterochelin esterase-like enzyme